MISQWKHRQSFLVQTMPLPWLFGFALFLAAATGASIVHAQQPQSSVEARIIVVGDGSITVKPDHAHLTSGVSTTAKTVKAAIDANSKLMTDVTAALRALGIAQNDIQTSRFSVQPVYAPPEPRTEPKVSGYRVTNQVSVIIREIGKVGEVIDRLATTGVTDIGNLVFLLSDKSKAIDQAREAAIADARRKAEIYARASSIQVGSVRWIAEDFGPLDFSSTLMRSTMSDSATPISSGEGTFRVRVTVAYEIAR